MVLGGLCNTRQCPLQGVWPNQLVALERALLCKWSVVTASFSYDFGSHASFSYEFGSHASFSYEFGSHASFNYEFGSHACGIPCGSSVRYKFALVFCHF